MAARVNTKFVVILATSIVVIAGLMVGVFIYAKGTTAEQYATQSQQREARYEQAMADGDIEKASGLIRSAATFAYRAYEKGQDPEQLLRSVELLKKYQAKDAPDAQQHLGYIRKQAKDLADKYPGVAEYQEYYFGLLYDLTHKLGGPQSVAQMESEAQAALDVSPDNLAALRARGIARTRRLSDQMAVDQRQQAADDLERVLAVQPGDPRATFYLAVWKINESDRLRRSNQRPELAEKLRTDAVTLTRELLEVEPENAQRLYYHIEALRMAGLLDEAEMQAVTERFRESVLDGQTDRRLAILAARFQPAVARIASYDTPEAQRDALRAANERQAETLRAVLEHRPDDPLIRLHLGTALRATGKPDEASAELDRARTRGGRSPVLDFFANSSGIDDATFAYSDLFIQRALTERDPEQRADYLAKAEEAAMVLVNKQLNPQVTDSLLGRIDYARRQWMSAANRLTRASDARENRDIRLLALAAEALDRSGQPTAAIRRYEMALELASVMPGLDPVATRLRLATLYLNQRDLQPAKSQLDLTLAQDPDNRRAQLLLTRYHELSDRPEAALQVLDAQTATDEPGAALARAAILRRMGRTDDALTTIREAAVAHPDNLQLVLQELLLTPSDQPDRRLALADRAKELGARPDRLDLIVKQVQGQTLSDDELATLMLRDQDDPIVAKISRARFVERQGNRERRRALFAEAEAEAPDHASVILAGFDFALMDDEFDKARDFATRGARDNLDLVGGNLFQARLASAEGRNTEAITFINRAIEQNSVNASLWEQLGQLEARTGDLDGAEIAFETALRQNIRSVGSLLGLALIRQQQGQTAEALDLVRRAYALRPTNPTVRDSYFAFEAAHGDPERVVSERRDRAESNPEDRQNRRALALTLARLDRFDQAVAVATALLEEDDEALLADAAVLAQVRLTAGSPELAEQVLTSHIARRGPEADSRDHLALARFYVQRQQPNQAVEAFEAAVERETPDNRDASLALADYLSGTNRADRAVTIYRDLLDTDPQNDDLLAKLAAVCIRLNLPDEALSAVGQMRPSPRRALLAAQLANLRGDRDTALAELATGLDANPDNSQLRLLRAQTLAAMTDRQAEAITELEALIESGQEVRPARRLRARLLALDPETQGRAISELRSLVGQQADDDASRRVLIATLERQGSYGEAAVVASEVIEAGRGTSGWYTLAGRLLALDNQPDRAIARLEEGLSLEATPQGVNALFNVLVGEQRFSELVTASETYIQTVNNRPLLEAVKARALIVTGQTDPGRNLFASLLSSVNDTRVESLIIAQYLLAGDGDDAVAWLGQTLGSERAYDLAIYRGLHHFQKQDYAGVVAVLGQVERAGLTPARLNRLDSLLAQSLHAADRYAEAAAAYERALDVNPDDFSSLNNLAVILAEDLDQPERALGYAQRADSLRPGIPEVVDTIGFCLLRLERYSEAQEKLEESRLLAVASRGRPLPLTLVHLAELHLAQENFRRAEIEANAAIKAARQVNDNPAMQRAQTVLEQLDSR
ncbi:MAG: tetratricopeptide repeat protein [Planctomycetota bacterium]